MQFKEYEPQKREGNTWCYASTPSAYNDNVHYELIKRGVFFFVEFHIETYANGRDELIKELCAKFSFRQFAHFTYYSSNFWQTRMPVFSAEDVEKDIKAMRKIVESVIGMKQSAIPETISQLTVGICSMTLEELLKENLSIPPYQRAYCWRQGNILDLIEDIKVWQIDHNADDDIYHLGTIILKKNESGIAIVDGQQRLTTLAIWKAIKEATRDIPLLKNPLANNNQTENVRQCLLHARETVKNCPGSLDFQRIEFSVVILAANQPDDLAHTFFSNTNSAGKRLSDYDLLKTHHLRYVSDEMMATVMVNRWHQIEKAGQHGELLHQLLFRLRNWRNNTPFFLNADNTPSRDIFRHYTVEIEPIPGLLTPPHPFRFDSILSGGLEFFNYVEHYWKMLKDFNAHPVIRELTETFQWHSNGILYAGMKALAFLFYCRFGDIYLKEAVYCIAYRISSLRNKTRVMGKYLLTEPIFSQCTVYLDRVTYESEFLAWLLDTKHSYNITNLGNTAQHYWHTLAEFLERQEKLFALPGQKKSTLVFDAIKNQENKQ